MTSNLDGKSGAVIIGSRGSDATVVGRRMGEVAHTILTDINADLGTGCAAHFFNRTRLVRADVSGAGIGRLAGDATERPGRVDVLAQLAGIHPSHITPGLAKAGREQVVAAGRIRRRCSRTL